ncbi:hypothetical protein [Sphingobium sp. CR28]|uniref:hypothetical protein n=1 Tax=Sphingobium sp. CR28 TaxID=3400272 RepID=UPI003FEE97C9
MSERELPAVDFGAPAEMTENERHWYGAQAAVQGIGLCLGFPHGSAEQVAIPTDDIYEALGSAIAMLLSVDTRLATPGDVRRRAEEIAKYAGRTAKTLREAEDQTGQRLMDAFRIEQTEIRKN